MADIYVKSGGGTIGTGSYRGNWTANGTYALGDRVCGVAVSDYWIFECTTAGTSAGAEPTWVKTAGSTTTDNTVTWTARIPSTWADATFTLAKAATNSAAGDSVYVSKSHTESSAAALTITFPNIQSNPVKVLCVDDTGNPEPPTTLATTTGSISTTGSTFSLIVNGCAYIYGLKFVLGNSASTIQISIGAANNNNMVIDNCWLKITGGSAVSKIWLGNVSTGTSSISSALALNCTFEFGNAGQALGSTTQLISKIKSCNFVGTAITTVVATPRYQSYFEMIDTDLSGISTTASLVTSPQFMGVFKFINCKLPVSWSGTLVGGTGSTNGARTAMYNCDSGATNYRLWIETYAGSIKSETTIVKSGGATDGTTPISWKLATTANANEFVAPLITDDMAVWIDSGLGSPKTITIDILHDSATALTDSEVWVEIDYLGTSNSPLGTPASDKRATVLTTPANHPASTTTWFTTGVTTPNKQKLEVTFTPNMRGFVYARVCLAKPSYTVYVDPQPVIT